MKLEEMQWETDDGLQLFTRRWEPESATKGIVCLVHGIGEHSGRYAHWAEMLTGAGYTLSAMDLRGHGRSGGQRGDAPTFDHLGDDVNLLLTDAANRYPDKPCFLYGHSLGGLVVLFYLIQRSPALNGAVVSSPVLHLPAAQNRAKVVTVRFLSLLSPGTAMANELELNALSRDPAVVEAYRHDPLVHDRITVRTSKGMIDAIEYVFSRAPEINLPLLLMHGTGDRITFPSGSEELAGLAGDKCKLELWEGMYHELHNEPEKDKVFASLKSWLDSKL